MLQKKEGKKSCNDDYFDFNPNKRKNKKHMWFTKKRKSVHSHPQLRPNKA